MKTYRAIYEVPAIVQVEVVVKEVENQVAALVAAQDLLLTNQTSCVTVLSLNTDLAANTSLEPEDATSLPTAPWESFLPEPINPTALMGAPFLVKFYKGELPKEGEREGLVFKLESICPETAKGVLELLVAGQASTYGSGVVIRCSTGETVHSLQNERGGWEVEYFNEAQELVRRTTWLTRMNAMALAKQYVANHAARVTISDYTNRLNGSVHHRSIA